jgi:parallel beta-helix repeat protein
MLLRLSAVVMLMLVLLAAGCQNQVPAARTSCTPNTRLVKIDPGPGVEEVLLTALIKAKAGTTIQLTEGVYHFSQSMSLTASGVTIEGAGMDKTILSFARQTQGKEGLHIEVNFGDITIQNLTIEDTKGDALKVVGSDHLTIRQVRTRWTAGPLATNGGYGLYPVRCSHVLIDSCEAECASDAGIYVGQSSNVIVRNCKTSRNVAGIEIENSTNVDVFDNLATNNTGGILVFDLPNLPVKNGKAVRVFKNKVHGNNHANFAPAGNIVATVPPGTGMMVLATDQVECFENEVKDNKTTGLAIISYQLTMKPINDKEYDPYPEATYIHDNVFTNNGTNPDGEMGKVLGALLGKPMPDILFDGNTNPAKYVDGKLPDTLALKLGNNGAATFANLNYNGKSLFSLSKAKVDRNAANYQGTHPGLPVVEQQSGQR